MKATSHSTFILNFMQSTSLLLKESKERMNYHAESPKLELKLNISPPRQDASPKEISPRSSCVSREASPDGALRYSSSPEGGSSLMLVGCPRCLMYVMLFEEDPRCPKCKSTVLLDFLHDKTRILNN